MLYLFLGYASLQFYFSLGMLKSDYPMSVLLFSIAVFVIWSFIPVFGYLLARFVGAKGQSHPFALVGFGLIAGLIEKALYHFNIISFQGDMLGTIIAGAILFLSAFISLFPPQQPQVAASNS